MEDEILSVLHQQLEVERYKTLYTQRLEAYKFLNSAYNYVDCRACVEDDFDSREQKLLFAFNHLTGLSRKSNRDQLLTQIAETRYIVQCRMESNPYLTESEQKLFDIVESFRVKS
jgi:hypothetical protein